MTMETKNTNFSIHVTLQNELPVIFGKGPFGGDASTMADVTGEQGLPR